MERCGCIKHMDSSAGEHSVADAPIQDNLTVAFHSDIEPWAYFDTVRGEKEQRNVLSEMLFVFLFYLQHTIAAVLCIRDFPFP